MEAEGLSVTATLQAAARAGDTAQVAEALAAGADPCAQDDWGLAPLHSATLGSFLEVVKLLIDGKAALEDKSASGKTALHLAASEGDEAILAFLISRRADLLTLTPTGSSPLELAKQRGSSCVALLLEALQGQREEAKKETEELRARLRDSEQLWSRTQDMLAAEEGAPAPREGLETPLCSLPPLQAAHEPLAPMRLSYWQQTEVMLFAMQRVTREALARVWLRPQYAGRLQDSFTWTGSLISQGSPLPEADPEDAELVAGLERLTSVSVETRWLQERSRKTASVDGELESEIFNLVSIQAVEHQTGRSQQAWDRLVESLLQPSASWDWSSVEVRQRADAEGEANCVGVWAVRPPDLAEGAAVFLAGDVIGPMGGTLRRRSRYEALYYPDHEWRLHDPLALELYKRAEVVWLKTEPLVLDLACGPRQNRLRYLGDVSGSDPLGLLGDRVELASPVSTATWRSSNRQSASQQVSQPPANTKLVEVSVGGCPYAFAVAERDIMEGEELLVDRGEDYWAAHRAAFSRVLDIRHASEDLLHAYVKMPRSRAGKPPAL